jgi:hypothetical protein
MERDLAKLGMAIIIGAILVNVATHGNVFVSILDTLRRWWLGSVSVVAGGSANVQ